MHRLRKTGAVYFSRETTRPRPFRNFACGCDLISCSKVKPSNLHLVVFTMFTNRMDSMKHRAHQEHLLVMRDQAGCRNKSMAISLLKVGNYRFCLTPKSPVTSLTSYNLIRNTMKTYGRPATSSSEEANGTSVYPESQVLRASLASFRRPGDGNLESRTPTCLINSPSTSST